MGDGFLDVFKDVMKPVSTPRSGYRDMVRQEAQSVGVDPDLADRAFGHESGYNPNAVSYKGAQGIPQIMPATETYIRNKYGVDTSTPRGKTRAGLLYLKEHLDEFKDPALALAAYHAGPGAVLKAGNRIPNTSDGLSTTRDYVSKILNGYKGAASQPSNQLSNDSFMNAFSDVLTGGNQQSAAAPPQPDMPQVPTVADVHSRINRSLRTPAFSMVDQFETAPQQDLPAATVAADQELPTGTLDFNKLLETLPASPGVLDKPETPFSPISPTSAPDELRGERFPAQFFAPPQAPLPLTREAITAEQGRLDAKRRELSADAARLKLTYQGGMANSPDVQKLRDKFDIEKQEYNQGVDGLKKQIEDFNKQSPQKIPAITPTLGEMPVTENRLAEQEPVNISAGAPMGEDDVYREWYKARQSGDINAMRLVAQSYLEQFPDGKYSKAVLGNTQAMRPTSTQDAKAQGAGAYVSVADLEAMRKSGMPDQTILKNIQDKIAGDIGLSQTDVAALTEKYGQHPLANIVEPGSDARASIDSIIRQGRSNQGLAEFNIRPETVQMLHGEKQGALLNPSSAQAQATVAGQHYGSREFLKELANDKDVRRETPEIASIASIVSESPQALRLFDDIGAGGMQHAAGVAQTVSNLGQYLRHPGVRGEELLSDFLSNGSRTARGTLTPMPKSANAEIFSEYAQNLGESRPGEPPSSATVKKWTKSILDMFPFILTAEAGGVGGVGAYGFAEHAHEGPGVATINALASAGPFAIVGKSPLGGYFKDAIVGKLAPTPEIIKLALEAGTREEAIDTAAKAIRAQMLAEMTGLSVQAATNASQFLATSAAVTAASQGRAMTADEIKDQVIMLVAMEAIPAIRAAAEIPGRVGGVKSGLSEALTEGRAAEMKNVSPQPLGAERQLPGENPPAPISHTPLTDPLTPEQVRGDVHNFVGQTVRKAQAIAEAERAQAAPPVPETPETLGAQMLAMQQGKRQAVLVTHGEDLPVVPSGYKTTTTSEGTFIHSPEIRSSQIRWMVREGTFGELLGHVAPKPAPGEPAATVAARDGQGKELQSSVVPPELASQQAESLKQQFPDANIEIGGEETAAKIIADRAKENEPLSKRSEMTTALNNGAASPVQAKPPEIVKPLPAGGEAQSSNKEGPLYRENERLRKSAKPGEQVYGASSTDETIQAGSRFGESLSPGTVIEESNGGRWEVEGQYLVQLDDDGKGTSSVYRLRDGKKQGGGWNPQSQAISVLERSRIVPGGEAESSAKKESEVRSQESGEETKHEFSSTQVNLPDEIAKPIKALANSIPDSELAEDGRETQPHITVKHGLHSNDVKEISPLLKNEKPITVKLGKISLFPASEKADYDVIKADVDSPDLHRLNKKIADALPHTDTHPTYQPHVTLAYVKPGKGQKYVGRTDLEGKEVTLHSIAFSDKDGNQVEIPLGGKNESANLHGAEKASTEAPGSLADRQADSHAPIESEGGNPSQSEGALSPEAAKSKASRQLAHEQFGTVTVADNQSSVPDGKLRVTDESGAEHIIQNPRKSGNQSATFIKPAEKLVDSASQEAQNAQQKESVDDRQPDKLGNDGKTPLASQSAEDVQPAPTERQTPTDLTTGSGNGEGSLPATDRSGDGRPGSQGDRPERIHSTSERERPAGALGERSGSGQPDAGNEQSVEPDTSRTATQAPSASKVSSNYRIKDTESLTGGGAKTKFKQNIEAIGLLRKLESEGRSATGEEQGILAKYSGWGQFPQAFDLYNKEWAQEREDLKALLGDTEFAAARRSTLNAHYTSPEIVQAMWNIGEKLGFKGGRVLEPSMGVGNFFGLMPDHLMQKSALTGVELDPVTGKIAKLLYPDENVQIKGFEQHNPPDGFYDVAIGNVPFGDYKVNDPAYNRYRANIHNYFFLKSLDKVRPGGLVQFITSTGTMDSVKATKIREALASKADLVAAIRLPENTFQKNAGTAVVTDLIILRKRFDGEESNGIEWANLKTLPDPDGGDPISINEYFANNPEQILGTLDRKSRMYGRGDSHVTRTDDFEKRFADAVQRLPENILKPAPKREPAELKGLDASGVAKDGGYAVRKGKVYIKQGDQLVEKAVDKKNIERIEKIIAVRDAVREVFNSQLRGESETQNAAYRKKLNAEYDGFVKQYGALNSQTNKRIIADDPDAPVLLALEKWDAKTKQAEKADVFSKNTVKPYARPEKAETPAEALGISLNESGTVDVERIADLLGVSEKKAGNHLVKNELAFNDPKDGWQAKDIYLSGNVRKKLGEAREAALVDAQYLPNVKALEKVQPEDVDYSEIDVRLGAPWVPIEDIQDFMGHMLNGAREDFQVNYLRGQGEWLVGYTTRGANLHKGSQKESEVYGTRRAGFAQVLQSAMSDKPILIYDKVDAKTSKLNHEESAAAMAKVAEVREAFKDWVWTDDKRRARLHRYYNDNFNNIRLIKYDASHYKSADGTYVLPGMNPAISLRPHQANGVWQVVSTGRGLFAHEVGTGKTFTMGASAMELRRLGLAKKPAIAVPKSIIEGFVSDIRALYPNARIIATGEKFDAANRKKTISQIATGDWDMVIMTHDNLDMLPMRPEVTKDFIQREMDELEAVIREAKETEAQQNGGRAKKNSRFVKQLEKNLARLQARLEDAIEGSHKDNAVFFEETGIDHLFVDEAHKYKSLPVYTTRNRIKGIPTSRSDRATNMLMRSRWLQEQNKGRGVVFATGTPVANTMVELYNLQRYLQYSELEERGITAFDAWANTFGETVTKMEYTVTGDYAPVTRFAKYTNLPELLQLSRQVMDVQRIDDMGTIKRPTKIEDVISIPMSSSQIAYLEEIRRRAELLKKVKGPPQKGDDNMLKLSSDARKSAMDMRLVDPRARDEEDNKSTAVANKVLEIHKANPGKTQMIFSDLGVHPTDTGFSMYGDIINKLVAGGIPANRIINFSALTDAQKRDAVARLRNGDALVGLGSTDKLGTGVNAQDKLLALHHIDVPWLPASVEQRDGRGWRQGNENPKINVFRYVTTGSFDTFMWQVVDAKSRFIKQAMSGNMTERVFKDEDTEEMSPAKVMAIASGNPELLTKVQLDEDIADLERGRKRHEQAQLRLKDNVSALENRQTRLKKVAADSQEDTKLVAASAGVKDFSLTVAGKDYTERDQASRELTAAAMRAPSRDRIKIGEYRGFDVVKSANELYLKRPYSESFYNITVSYASPENTIRSLEAVYRNIPGRAKKVANELALVQGDLDTAKSEIGKPFKKAGDLAAKKSELADLVKRLQDKKPDDEPPASEAEAEVNPSDKEAAEHSNKQLAQINATVRTKGAEARLYVNTFGADLINEIIKRSDNTDLAGITLTAEQAKLFATVMRDFSGLESISPDAAQAIDGLAEALEQASKLRPNVVVVNRDLPGAQRIVSSVRHEEGHNAQKILRKQNPVTLDASNVVAHPEFSSVRDRLLKAGYPNKPEILADEMAVRIMGNQLDSIGLSKAKAFDLLDLYFKMVENAYGVEAVKNFTHIHPSFKRLRDERFKESPTINAGDESGARQVGEQGQGRSETGEDLHQAGEGPRDEQASLPPGNEKSVEVEKAGPDEKGAVSLNLLSAGTAEFFKQDVIPTVRDVAVGLVKTRDTIRKIFAPQNRTPQAKETSHLIRETAADLAQRYDRAEQAMAKARKYFSSKDAAENFDFIDRIENGQAQPNPKLDAIAQTMRDILDSDRIAVQTLGKGKLQNFYQDYFPHIWKDPKKAASVFSEFYGKRPMEGAKSFLKKRSHPTFQDGLAAGLEPVSNNPVDLVLAKHYEIRRYVAAQQILAEMKDKGLARYINATNSTKTWDVLDAKGNRIAQAVKKKEAKRYSRQGYTVVQKRGVPDGYKKIDDKIATVYAPMDAEGTMRIRGHYYAPEAVAQVLNNYLSPGLRGNDVYRAYMAIGNTLNQAQLGLSAFHLGMTSIDAVTSKVALAINQLAYGKPIDAMTSLVTSPLAPVANAMRGNKVLQEWFSPGSQGAQIGAIVDALKSGGGRVRQDAFYKTEAAKQMMDAFRSGNLPGGILRLPFAIIEKSAKPLMEYIVPRQKLGVFADIARVEIERLGASATPEQVREVMAKAWDSVDNRMGQLVYDNLFWNKAAKDLAMASTRSLGWNLGTIREIGGAGFDVLAQINKMLHGKKPEVTYRMAYTMALPIVVGILGGILMFLMTGKRPQELQDYFFPQTGNLDENGNPERVQLPSYMKDVFAYANHPLTTLMHKTHPLLNMIGEMLHNEDYYGVEIRNEDDPVMQQAFDELKHVGKGFLPFGVRGYQQEADRNSPISKRLLPFVGITPAPSELNKTKAEKLISQYVTEKLPQGARTKEEFEKSKTRQAIIRKLRAGDDSPQELQDALKKGLFSDEQVKQMREAAEDSPIENGFKRLSVMQAQRVFAVATEKERELLRPHLLFKFTNQVPGENGATAEGITDSVIGITGTAIPKKEREALDPELQRLQVKIPFTDRDVTIDKKKVKLPDKKFEKLQGDIAEKAYKGASKLVALPEFSTLSEKKMKEVLSDYLGEIRDIERDEVKSQLEKKKIPDVLDKVKRTLKEQELLNYPSQFVQQVKIRDILKSTKLQ